MRFNFSKEDIIEPASSFLQGHSLKHHIHEMSAQSLFETLYGFYIFIFTKKEIEAQLDEVVVLMTV